MARRWVPNWVRRVLRRGRHSTLYQVHERYSRCRGNRLAAAITYYGFLSLFPLFAVAVATVAATFGPEQVKHLQHQITQNIPGIADRLQITSVVHNADTIGVISALVLVYSGLGWVDVTRAGVRTIWGSEDEPGNPVIRKVSDLGSLVGLGLAMAVSLAASTLVTSVAGDVLSAVGVRRSGLADVLLVVLGIVVGIGISMVLFGYLLAGISRVTMPRRVLLGGALIGAICFEILKVAIGSYLTHVATKNVYGAFGTPIALLVWINMASRLLLYTASLTAVVADRPLPEPTEDETPDRATGTRHWGGRRLVPTRWRHPIRHHAPPRARAGR